MKKRTVKRRLNEARAAHAFARVRLRGEGHERRCLPLAPCARLALLGEENALRADGYTLCRVRDIAAVRPLIKEEARALDGIADALFTPDVPLCSWQGALGALLPARRSLLVSYQGKKGPRERAGRLTGLGKRTLRLCVRTRMGEKTLRIGYKRLRAVRFLTRYLTALDGAGAQEAHQKADFNCLAKVMPDSGVDS